MDIKRGDVYWWHCPEHRRPHLLNKTRPVVVVSNDQCNKVSKVIAVAPLTTQVHRAFPTQVPVVVNDGISIVLCDKVTSIPVEELGYKLDTLKDFQMEQVDKALSIQLGLLPQQGPQEEPAPQVEVSPDNKWTPKSMEEFCRLCDTRGVEAAQAKYKLSFSTAKAYYHRFQKKNEGMTYASN